MANCKAVFLLLTSAKRVWRRPAGRCFVEVVGKAVALGLR